MVSLFIVNVTGFFVDSKDDLMLFIVKMTVNVVYSKGGC